MKNRVFVVAALACLVFAGWALWSGGILDGPVAREVRASSVYAAPGIPLDEAAAERVVGNRRLVVVFLARDADLRDTCHDVGRAAAGTVVVLLSPGDDDWDVYGCAQLPGDDDENFGKAFVAETVLPRGVDQFLDRPLDAVKVIAVNYDLLVKSGTVPDGARVISPSLPRYLAAAAALAAVVVGAAVLYGAARRVGRRAAARQESRLGAADDRSRLRAAAAELAQRIIDLDGRPGSRRLALDYSALLDDIAARDTAGAARDTAGAARDTAGAARDAVGAARDTAGAARGTAGGAARGGADDAALTARVEVLNDRARRLTARSRLPGPDRASTRSRSRRRAKRR